MVDTASVLATWLDGEMFNRRTPSVPIAPAGLHVSDLPRKTGLEVFDETGGRLLAKYIIPYDIGRYRGGASGQHWLTLTAYSPSEAAIWLALPSPNVPREYALLLDPRRIPTVYGPQWVAQPGGVQYIVLDGFPASAIVVPGSPGATWEVKVQ